VQIPPVPYGLRKGAGIGRVWPVYGAGVLKDGKMNMRRVEKHAGLKERKKVGDGLN
jgi:hypothetical protein